MNETMDTEIVWTTLKEIARAREKSEVSMEELIFLLRRNKIEQDGKKLRKILVGLHGQGKIVPLPSFRFRVNVPENELELGRKASTEATVTDDKIRLIIRKFYNQTSEFPRPSDIERRFWEEYGKPNLKDFTRYLRDLAERKNPVLLRTVDSRYYFKGLTTEENNGLKTFVKEQLI